MADRIANRLQKGRELLRAAISRSFEAMIESLIAERRGAPFVERRLQTFQSADRLHDSQLRAPLIIDEA